MDLLWQIPAAIAGFFGGYYLIRLVSIDIYREFKLEIKMKDPDKVESRIMQDLEDINKKIDRIKITPSKIAPKGTSVNSGVREENHHDVLRISKGKPTKYYYHISDTGNITNVTGDVFESFPPSDRRKIYDFIDVVAFVDPEYSLTSKDYADFFGNWSFFTTRQKSFIQEIANAAQKFAVNAEKQAWALKKEKEDIAYTQKIMDEENKKNQEYLKNIQEVMKRYVDPAPIPPIPVLDSGIGNAQYGKPYESI